MLAFFAEVRRRKTELASVKNLDPLCPKLSELHRSAVLSRSFAVAQDDREWGSITERCRSTAAGSCQLNKKGEAETSPQSFILPCRQNRAPL